MNRRLHAYFIVLLRTALIPKLVRGFSSAAIEVFRGDPVEAVTRLVRGVANAHRRQFHGDWQRNLKGCVSERTCHGLPGIRCGCRGWSGVDRSGNRNGFGDRTSGGSGGPGDGRRGGSRFRRCGHRKGSGTDSEDSSGFLQGGTTRRGMLYTHAEKAPMLVCGAHSGMAYTRWL